MRLKVKRKGIVATILAELGKPGARRGPGNRQYFSLINQLRGIASLLVVWAHLVGQHLEQTGRGWIPFSVVDGLVQQPLAIIQDFGWFGVALFFFISGFVISHAATRESGGEFVVKRLLRIYPPLIFSLLLIFAFHAIGLAPLPVDGAGPWLLAATLANYVVVPQIIISGVAWTLAIEVIFYAFVWALNSSRSLHEAIMPGVTLVVVTVVVAVSRDLGPSFFLFAVCLSYVPLLVIGQLVYLAFTHRLPFAVGVIGVAAAWAVFVYGLRSIQPAFLAPDNSYGANAAMAFLVFVCAAALEGRVRPLRALSIVAARSYSLYLVHGVVGLTVLHQLETRFDLSYTVSLGIALVLVALATEVSYRLVEKKSVALGKRLFRARTAMPAVL